MKKSHTNDLNFLLLLLPFELDTPLASVLFSFLLLTLSGCATVPPKGGMPYYSIHGANYVPLVSLCTKANVKMEYDVFSRTAMVSNSSHRVSVHAGDKLALVDGIAKYLSHPVEMHQGTIVVPSKFKEQIFDALFLQQKAPQVIIPTCHRIRKIIIDAGHGGKDPGAIGKSGLREKDVTLDIAKRLSELFKREGITTVMTRSSDKFIPLEGRVRITNSAGADLFVSVHANANRSRSLNGFEVYYVSPTVSDYQRALSSAKTAKLEFDDYCVPQPSLNLKAILWDMMYTCHRAESVELSRTICKVVNKDLDVDILGVKAARYYVLKGASVPAVLIEVGFVSNPKEEQLLRSYFYRQKLAQSIHDGIIQYSQDLAFAERN